MRGEVERTREFEAHGHGKEDEHSASEKIDEIFPACPYSLRRLLVGHEWKRGYGQDLVEHIKGDQVPESATPTAPKRASAKQK